MKCPVCKGNLRVTAVIDKDYNTTVAEIKCLNCHGVINIIWPPECAPITNIITGKNKV